MERLAISRWEMWKVRDGEMRLCFLVGVREKRCGGKHVAGKRGVAGSLYF